MNNICYIPMMYFSFDVFFIRCNLEIKAKWSVAEAGGREEQGADTLSDILCRRCNQAFSITLVPFAVCFPLILVFFSLYSEVLFSACVEERGNVSVDL